MLNQKNNYEDEGDDYETSYSDSDTDSDLYDTDSDDISEDDSVVKPMKTDNYARFHWSRIKALKFKFKPTIRMWRGQDEILISRKKRNSLSGNKMPIVAIFDRDYVIETTCKFLDDFILSDLSREEWDEFCNEIWNSFHAYNK